MTRDDDHPSPPNEPRSPDIRPAIIFDLDGTLADTLDDITDAVNELLGAIGRPLVKTDDMRGLIGEGLPILIQRASGISDSDVIAELVDRYRPVYTSRMLRKTRLYPGIEGLLDALTAADVAMCVLSNKPHVYTLPICDALLSRWPFVRCCGHTDGYQRKPDPTKAVELAGAMGRKPCDTMFVGDSTVDIATARAAGMRSVAVTWGFRRRAELLAAEPDQLIDEPMALVNLVGPT